MRTALACALALASLLAAAPSARAQSSNRYLSAAMKLYADLEYESALDNLKKAREKGGLSDEEDIQSSLYMGLIQFELGHETEAESAFKAALALKCDAALPKAVSPKVVSLFEKSRRDIWKGAACPVAQPKTTPTQTTTSTATDAPKDPKLVTVTPAPDGPVVPLTQRPEVATQAGSSSSLALAVGVPLMVVGAGILGGGGYFGLQANDYVAKMNDPDTWQNDPVNHLDVPTYHQKASDAAANANIMFGVGAAVVVAGAVTMIAILASSGGDAPSSAGTEMPGR